VTRVGVLGPGTTDIIELPGHEPVQRPGGTTLYAARALRFAGAEPVVIENPGLVISRLRHTEEGTVQAIDRVAEPADPGWLAERLDRFDGCSWVMLGGQTADDFPAGTIALLAERGHRMLLDVQGPGRYRKLGGTRDDAAGEAYDKVGKMLGLPYPGGPEIEKIAKQGDPAAFDFPRSMLHDPHHDFSFSGLKTAVLYTIQGLGDPAVVMRDETTVANLAASFQQAVIEILVGKTVKAARKAGHKLIALSGGVSLNGTLRAAFEAAGKRHGFKIAVASPTMCTDNAAMIAFAALLRHLAGETSPLDADIDPNLALV